MEVRFIARILRGSQPQIRSQARRNSSKSPSQARPSPQSEQALPLGDYYNLLLASPSPSSPPIPITPSALHSTPKSSQDSPSTKPEPSILFSSRLTSPLERRSEIEKHSQRLAGVLVPPRPEEPDNCCMSGCVNCVWERYREDLEEWVGAKSEVERRLKATGDKGGRDRRKAKGKRDQDTVERDLGASMDDDGGGSDGLWGNADFSILGRDEKAVNEELFKDIPVGIREFMKQEKRLKEKHAREGTSGG